MASKRGHRYKEISDKQPRELVIVKLCRSLFSADGKDHFILQNQDGSIFVDTTEKAIISRSKWILEEDIEQYWEAEVIVTQFGKTHIKLLKRIADQHWED